MTKNDDVFYTLEEAARYAKETRQAIYLALNKGAMKGYKIKGKWVVTAQAIDAYRANKYNRDKLKHEGERVFDPDKGTYSVQQVAKVFSEKMERPYRPARIYYLLRTGQIKASRKGCAWIITAAEAQDLFEKEMGITVRDPMQLRFV